jgi:hypothetical protein
MSQFCRICAGVVEENVAEGREEDLDRKRRGPEVLRRLVGSVGLLPKHSRLERSSKALLELLLQDYLSAI